MAGLYNRVDSRGFPSSVYAGMTGAGALESQGGPYDPAHGDSTGTGGTTQTLTGYAPEGPPDPSVPILEGAWGLAGELSNPDQTPGGHAAPAPGWAGSYADHAALDEVNQNSREIHAQDFGGVFRRTQQYGVAETPMSAWSSNDPGGNVQQELAGQIRYMGGYDGTQGYGGGADGPGGTNSYGFGAGHQSQLRLSEPQPMIYLDPAERPFLVPQASGSFTPTDAVQGPGPWASSWDGGSIPYDDPSAYDSPAQPATLETPLAAAPVSSGWW